MRRIDRLKDTPSEQSHAFVAFKIFLRWSVKHGLLERSPIDLMSAPTRQMARERTLSDEEISAVYSAAQSVSFPFGTIVQLLLLTGQRRGEIAALQWGWLDQPSKTITLPSSITKNGRQHTFPYGDVVEAIFATVPVQGEFLFPARVAPTCVASRRRCSTWQSPRQALRSRLGRFTIFAALSRPSWRPFKRLCMSPRSS